VIILKNKETKEVKKETKTKKSFPKLVIVLAVLVLGGTLVYKFLYTKIRTRVAGSLASRSLSKNLPGDVNIEDDGEKVSYKGEDFEFSIDSGGELPEDFPKDFPVYKNSKLMSSWSSSDQEGSGTSVIWESEDSLEKVADFYKTELAKTGWTVTSTFSQSDETSVFSFEKGDLDGVLGIAKAEDKINISVTFSQK